LCTDQQLNGYDSQRGLYVAKWNSAFVQRMSAGPSEWYLVLPVCSGKARG
jgi:hypothetical protein